MADYLSRQELYELVWTEPVHVIAPRFGVSDVWFSKVCRTANVPLPARGYWAKVRNGKIVARVPLPPVKPGTSERVTIRSALSRPRPSVSGERLNAVLSSLPQIPVPDQLRRPHPFVTATRMKAKAERLQEDGRIYVRSERGIFQLRVSRDAVVRSLLLLQAICDEVARRGWAIESHSTVGHSENVGGLIAINGQTYPVSIEERTEAVPFTDDDVRRWRANRPSWVHADTPSAQERRRRSTGELALLVPSSWDHSRNRWADGKRARVEEKLAEFFATLEVRAVADEERHQRFERERLEREARERLIRIEKARAERLDRELAAARHANDIRCYVSRVRGGLDNVLEAERERLAAWCDWASARADRLDPAANVKLIVGLDDERDGYGW